MTQAPLIDSYDVRSVHNLFRDNLPMVERQAPVLHLEVAGMVGFAPPVRDMHTGVPTRWWFVSEDGTELQQLQEHFIATNWRRHGTPPGEEIHYPGFANVADRFKSALSKLELQGAAEGRSLPSPAGGELLYDNLIPLKSEGAAQRRVDEVLAEYTRSDDRRLLGFQMHWLERIDELPEDDRSTLQVQIAIVAIMMSGFAEPLPVVKLQFNAGAVRETWDELISFFEVAHTHIRRRLMALTTEGIQATWLPK